jgi:hypothetical protein
MNANGFTQMGPAHADRAPEIRHMRCGALDAMALAIEQASLRQGEDRPGAKR